MYRWLARNLGNVSVSRKLGIGFGLVLLLTLLITATGWTGLGRVIDRGDKLDQRLFELSDKMASSSYLSTQERNALFLAGRGLLGKPETAWKVVLDGSGGEYPLSNEQPALALEGKLLSSDMSLRNQGSEPVYQQLTISGYPAQAPG